MKLQCSRIEIEENVIKIIFINPLEKNGNNINTDFMLTILCDKKRELIYEPGKFYNIEINE